MTKSHKTNVWKNLSSTAYAKHWVETTQNDCFGKGWQVDTCFELLNSNSSLLKKKVATSVSSNGQVLGLEEYKSTSSNGTSCLPWVCFEKETGINWDEMIESGDGNEFTVNHKATKRVWHTQPSLWHKGGKTGVSWIMSKVRQSRVSFNFKKKEEEETKSH